MSDTWKREWSLLQQAVTARGGPAFHPLSEGDRLSLHPKLEQTPVLDEFLGAGYPDSPISIDRLELFPDYGRLMTWCDEDPAWPRHWFPLNNEGHHWIYYLDAKCSGPVFSVWTDSDCGLSGRYLDGKSGSPAYHCLGAFLRAVRIGVEHVTEETVGPARVGILWRMFCGETVRRALPRDVLKTMRAEFGDEGAGSAVVVPWLRRGSR